MAFRDDREALRQRVDMLTRELSATREHAESLAGQKERAEELEEELAKALLRLNEIESPKRSHVPLIAGAAVATLMIAAVVGGVMVVRTSSSAVVAVAPPPVPTIPSPPPPIVPEPRHFEPIAFSAPVSDVTGRAPVHEGETCDVLIAPTEGGGFACRVTVSCDGETVYGGEGFGYLACEIVGGTPTHGSDVIGSADGGDPMLAMDLGRGTLRVSDDRPAPWSFVLTRPSTAREE
jgi:hypothetical protein